MGCVWARAGQTYTLPMLKGVWACAGTGAKMTLFAKAPLLAETQDVECQTDVQNR